jgi:DNA mismatch repair protein MutS
MAVRERGGEVTFLRKVVPGGASKSYGIEVARLAGLPRSVVARSRQILGDLERPLAGATPPAQLSLLAAPAAPVAPPDPLAEALSAIDIDHLTPLEAVERPGASQGLAGPQFANPVKSLASRANLGHLEVSCVVVCS